jgi:hypothetical protein
MRVSGLGVYAEVLADTEFQEVEEEKLAKEKKKAPSTRARSFGVESGRRSLPGPS